MDLNENYQYRESLPDIDDTPEQNAKKPKDPKVRLLLFQSAVCALGILCVFGLKAIGGEVFSTASEKMKQTVFHSMTVEEVRSALSSAVYKNEVNQSVATPDSPTGSANGQTAGFENGGTAGVLNDGSTGEGFASGASDGQINDQTGNQTNAQPGLQSDGQQQGQSNDPSNDQGISFPSSETGTQNGSAAENLLQKNSLAGKNSTLLWSKDCNSSEGSSDNGTATTAAFSGSKSGSSSPVNNIIMPVDGQLTSDFGYRIHPIYGTNLLHGGIDIGVESGTPVKAALPGVVKDTGYNSSAGNYITLSHSEKVDTKYAHLSKVAVAKDETVSQGQTIALSGNTGVSTGPHLHFEIRIGGVRINPLWILNI